MGAELFVQQREEGFEGYHVLCLVGRAADTLKMRDHAMHPLHSVQAL